jgi:hypothetical protein
MFFYDQNGTKAPPKAGFTPEPPRDPGGGLATSKGEDPAPGTESYWVDPIAGLFLGASNGAPLEAPSTPAGLVSNLVAVEMVRAIAWGGDRRRGTARIELGAGRYAGATLLVKADGDQLSVELEVPSGVDAEELSGRLTERFAEKGLVLREIDIR